MGGSSSKIARSTASGSKRKLPKTVSSPMNQHSPVPPTSTDTSPLPQSYDTRQQTQQGQQASPTPGPTVQPSPSSPSAQPSSTRSRFIDLDARDPTFSQNLRSIGPVNPTPTFSNTSTFQAKPTRSGSDAGAPIGTTTGQIFPDSSTNPALLVIRAREQAANHAQEEAESMGRKGFPGRTVVDSATLGAIVKARGAAGGMGGDATVEERWRLKRGVLEEKLGPNGKVFGAVV